MIREHVKPLLYTFRAHIGCLGGLFNYARKNRLQQIETVTSARRGDCPAPAKQARKRGNPNGMLAVQIPAEARQTGMTFQWNLTGWTGRLFRQSGLRG
jgi:hypothetical protein